MKYLSQVCLILLFSLLGELCRFLIPYPIPASIYGMVLLFAALALKIVPEKAVKDAGGFFTSILAVLFVAPIVKLLDCWDQLKDALLPLIVIVLVSTVITFAAAGRVTETLVKEGGEGDE